MCIIIHVCSWLYHPKISLAFKWRMMPMNNTWEITRSSQSSVVCADLERAILHRRILGNTVPPLWALSFERKNSTPSHGKELQSICFEEVWEYFRELTVVPQQPSWSPEGLRRAWHQSLVYLLISSESWGVLVVSLFVAKAPRILMMFICGCPKYWRELFFKNKTSPWHHVILSFHLWTSSSTLTWGSWIFVLIS